MYAELTRLLNSVRYRDKKLCDNTLCDPTFCCWTWETNPSPEAEDKNLRSSGLHVHVGYDNSDVNMTMDIMKYFDLYVGVPATLIEPANKRRELYGKAGECRVKDYGGEYRVLSSYFMSSDELLHWVFKASNDAVSAFEKEEYDINSLEARITNAISNNDANEAKSLVKEFGILV